MIVFMMKMMMMIITLNDRLAEEDFPVPSAGVSSPVQEQSGAPGVIIVQKPVLYSTPAQIKCLFLLYSAQNATCFNSMIITFGSEVPLLLDIPFMLSSFLLSQVNNKPVLIHKL